MSILFKKNRASFEGIIGVEEAEVLLQWLLKTPKARVNFLNCTHLHASNLQVLMLAVVAIDAWPQDMNLKTWLVAALGR